jgi:hypothetical protein
MNNGPQNYEFKQQLAALSLVEQVSIFVLIRQRLKRRRWTVSEVYPVVYVLG